MKVIIAGAGIGGLSAALAALHFGHDVIVLEKAEALRAVGAGIQLPPNAMQVFRALDLDQALAARAFTPDALETRMGRSGRQIFKVALSDASERWGAPYLHIHRGAYIDVLGQALRTRAPEALHLNSTFKSYVQSASSVAVTLTNGDTIHGDILIGADGIHSTVRTQMLGADQPRFTGNVAWRAVVPADQLRNPPPTTACAWFGAGRHAVTYHLGEGLVNFVGVVERSDWQNESWTERGELNDLAEDFANWHPIISALIQSIDPSQLYRWALFDRAPVRAWTDGAVALMGDAAHPMLPFLAQGAAMAVEDAWVLAQHLDPHHLAAYETQRKHRTTRVQAASRANMTTFHKRSKLSQIATYGPMWLGGAIAPSVVRGRFDWLYGHDVTAS